MKTTKAEKAPLLSVSDYAIKVSTGSLEWQNFHFTTENIFHINKLEDYIRLSNLEDLPQRPYRKEVFDFIFLTGGTVVRSKSLETYRFFKNQFFFLPPNQITAIMEMSRDASGYYCHFAGDIFFKKFFQKDLLQQFPFLHFAGNPVIMADEGATQFILALFKELEDQYRSGQQCDLNLVAVALVTLLVKVNKFSQPEKDGTGIAASRIAHRYKDLLHKNLFKKQKVKQYAELLAVSPEHLNRSVKIVFGRTAHEYLDEMLLLEAKVLLRQSTLNVSEIAYSIGKDNPGEFIRFFKSKTGITPKQYRVNI